jgi:hypothetical protein
MFKAAWLSAAVLLSLPAFAENPLGMQPGLYELKTVKIVTDGVDHSAQMSDAMAKMQAQMASMPPDKRAQMEAMMQQHGVNMNAGNGTMQVCMTAEQLKNNQLPVNQNGKCDPSYTQSGSTFTFKYSCPLSGGTSTGAGTVTRSADTITIVSDSTTSNAAGTHTNHAEMQMHYLGANCGAVKPTGAAQ